MESQSKVEQAFRELRDFNMEEKLNQLRDIAEPKKELIEKTNLSHLIKLNNAQRRVLELLKTYPNLGISEIYKELELSGRKGNELKKQLIEQGLVYQIEHRNTRGWKKYLRLTSTALNLL